MTLTPEVRAVRAVARLARLFECSLGDLSLTQYRVLAIVSDGGERATHLAQALAVAKPTVTAAVDGLVERGWLAREPVPGDRRAVRIALTAGGRDALHQAEAGMVDRLCFVLDASGDDGHTLDALARLGPSREGARTP
ncbi:MAG: MarR family winged helix-turn-helix transcriptional regulator [Acidimicrobiales bacterium]